ILASLAFRTPVDLKEIHTEGITAVSSEEIANARELGYRIKLLAIAKAGDRGVEARVHPTMIPAASPLSAVSGGFNACFGPGGAAVGGPDVQRAGRGRVAAGPRSRVGRVRDRPPAGAGPRRPARGPAAPRRRRSSAQADGGDPLRLLPPRHGPGPARGPLPGG